METIRPAVDGVSHNEVPVVVGVRLVDVVDQFMREQHSTLVQVVGETHVVDTVC